MNKNGFYSLIEIAKTMTPDEKDSLWYSLERKLRLQYENKMSTEERIIQLSKLVGGVIIITLLTLIYLK